MNTERNSERERDIRVKDKQREVTDKKDNEGKEERVERQR